MTGIVNISEIDIPDTSVNLQNIQIRAKAMETNGCWNNLRFKLSEINNFEYEIKALGTFESYGDCQDIIVYKDTLIDFRPSLKGAYIFHIIKSTTKIESDTMIVN